MGRKLFLVALGAAAAAIVLASRRRQRIVDVSGNGGSEGKIEDLRRLVGQARGQLRAESD